MCVLIILIINTVEQIKVSNFRTRIFDVVKTWIVGTCYRDLGEAVLTNTYNLCFGLKTRKTEYPSMSQFYYLKIGCYPLGVPVMHVQIEE